jgi:hypothetical protein
LWFGLTNVYLMTLKNPYMWGYLIIQSVYGIFLYAMYEFPAIPTIIEFKIRRYRLSLKRWLDESNGRLLPNSDVCAICLQVMDAYAFVEEGFSCTQILAAQGDSLVRTSCGHTFHSTCMREWMDTNHWFCPMDYTNIPLKLD